MADGSPELHHTLIIVSRADMIDKVLGEGLEFFLGSRSVFKHFINGEDSGEHTDKITIADCLFLSKSDTCDRC